MGNDPFLDALNAKAGTPAPAAVPSFGGLMGKIAAVEGTGQNPLSSARGIGQFTNATLLGTYKKHYPNSGLSDQQILALKDDPNTMTDMLGRLVQDNTQALTAAGHEATPGNVYLAHWFGQSGAKSILSADPGAPIESIVGASVVKANPNIRGLTAGQVTAMTAQKMGSDAPALQTAEAPQAPQAEPNDPFLQALDSATGNHAAVPGGPMAAVPMGAGGNGDQRPNGGAGGAGVDDRQGAPSGRGRLSVISSFDPALDAMVNGTNYLGNVQDRMAGLVHGAASIPETMMHAAAWVTDKTGAHRSAETLRNWSDKLDSATANLAHDPNSNNFAVGKFGGEVGALAPLAEVAPLTALAARSGKAGKIASALARYTDLAGQGAAAGALTSKGENAGESALTGAVLAPALGAAAEKVLPVVLKGVDAVANSRIAKAVSERLAAGDRGGAIRAVDAELPDAATQTIRKGSELAGWSKDEIAQGWRKGAGGQTEFAPESTVPKSPVKIDIARPGQPFPGDRAPVAGNAAPTASREVSDYVDSYLAGKGRGASPEDLKMQQFAANNANEIEQEFAARAAAENAPQAATGTASPDAPASQASPHSDPQPTPQPKPARKSRIDPVEVGRALGSNGSRSGIEAITDLPPTVEAHYLRLRAEGVPADQAVREADILNVGGKPTIAAVTRNPEDQAAVWEGAKQPTPEGRALSAQIAENNAAVLGKAQGMVEANGGVPYHGEAAQTAATALARASDAERQRVSDLYRIAGQQSEAEATVSAAPLATFFKTPEAIAPVTGEGRAFVEGMRRQLSAVGDNGKKPMSAADLERLRQSANDAFNPTGKEVNRLVRQFKDAIDSRFDEMGNASPAYKTARAAHKAWADAYETPEGVSKLIRRDTQGNFAHADNWRSAEGFVSSTNDKHFVQVVKQLKANGDTAALQRLKASVIQRAYEKATNNAPDRLGNATLNGKLFFDALNRVGKAKLEAVFSPTELAEIASIGRAARALSEAVPGTNNTSNTASALARALIEGKGGRAHTGSRVARFGGNAARLAGHGAGILTGHVGGNVAIEGVTKMAKVVGEQRRAAKLAAALRESMNPGAARASERARAQRMADALRRHRAAKAASAKMSPVTGPLDSRHRS